MEIITTKECEDVYVYLTPLGSCLPIPFPHEQGSLSYSSAPLVRLC